MSEHTGLPVSGYRKQSDENVAIVNVNKELEERVLRQIDVMQRSIVPDGATESGGSIDPRMVAIARTKMQEAFMWLNRAVFQPGRVKLPEDDNDEIPF